MKTSSYFLGLLACLNFGNAFPFPPQQNITRYLFITGDSYTATGFNISLRPQPSDRNPLGNPAYPGVTFSGGENWVDVAIFNRSRNSTLPEARGTVAYNFAVGTNTVNVSRTQLPPANVPHPIADMIDQVDEIEALFHNQSRQHHINWNAQNSIFISWFGINDIFYNGLFSDRNFTFARPYLRADINDYFEQYERLYTLGARSFLNILVPPIERTPVIQVQSNKIEQAQNLKQFWNQQIQVQNDDFLNRHPDAHSYVYNPGPLFNRILDNYAEYGAPNNTCFSYPAGQPCLWHDFIHPGLVIQEKLGEEIFEEIRGTGFFDA